MANQNVPGMGQRSIFDISSWMGPEELGGEPMYSAVEHFGSSDSRGEGKSGISNPLHAPPTDFANILVSAAQAQGAPVGEVINAWNMYKKNQYQFRGEHGYQQPIGIRSGQVERVPSQETENSVFMEIMREAREMESAGSAEGFPLTSSDASVVPKPNIPAEYRSKYNPSGSYAEAGRTVPNRANEWAMAMNQVTQPQGGVPSDLHNWNDPYGRTVPPPADSFYGSFPAPSRRRW